MLDNELLKDRIFQLWEYSVSHGKLLIRSPKNNNAPINIDLVFLGVEFISAPRFMEIIAIDKPSELEIGVSNSLHNGSFSHLNGVILRCKRGAALIASASWHIDAHERDIFWSPFA